MKNLHISRLHLLDWVVWQVTAWLPSFSSPSLLFLVCCLVLTRQTQTQWLSDFSLPSLIGISDPFVRSMFCFLVFPEVCLCIRLSFYIGWNSFISQDDFWIIRLTQIHYSFCFVSTVYKLYIIFLGGRGEQCYHLYFYACQSAQEALQTLPNPCVQALNPMLEHLDTHVVY